MSSELSQQTFNALKIYIYTYTVYIYYPGQHPENPPTVKKNPLKPAEV